LLLPLSLFVVHDPDHPLAAGVQVHMPHLYRLAITAAVAVEGAQQVGLQSSIASLAALAIFRTSFARSKRAVRL
jgi:hypothetical protein